jgi:hypothetical protein
VRFTPLDMPEIIRLAQMTKSAVPISGPAKNRSIGRSRTNEIAVLAGVRSPAPGKCRARMAKMMATMACPRSFCFEVRPRLRCRLILVKSSAKPTRPNPPIKKRTRSALAVRRVMVAAWAAK